jgi:hypothetical protein
MSAEKQLARTQTIWFNDPIKPAAPLLASVIRRVFFAQMSRLVKKGGRK